MSALGTDRSRNDTDPATPSASTARRRPPAYVRTSPGACRDPDRSADHAATDTPDATWVIQTLSRWRATTGHPPSWLDDGREDLLGALERVGLADRLRAAG